MPRLTCINPTDVLLVWPRVREMLKAALERGDLGRFDDLETDVLSGDALLWVVHSDAIEAAAVTQIVLTEKSKVCMVQACGGSRHERWVGLLGQIEKYAKEQGCRCVRIMGRKGWARVLKDYCETRVILERRL